MKSFFTIFTAMLLVLAFAFSISIAQEGWDDKVVNCPSVLFIDDTLHMWYTGNSPLPVGSIGSAFETASLEPAWSFCFHFLTQTGLAAVVTDGFILL